MLLFLLLWGCDKTTEANNDPQTDEEAINMLLEENDPYFTTQNHYGEEDTTGVKNGDRTEINTFFWYRELKPNPEYLIDIQINGDSAYVSIHGDYEGTLNLFAWENDSIKTYTKDFTDQSLRYAIFKQLFDPAEDPDHRRGWRLTHVSGAETGPENHTVYIDSVRLNCESYPDTLIIDPLAIFSKEELFTVMPEEPCTLTVYTNTDPENFDHVFLHSWRRHIQHHRGRFSYIGDGIYMGVWIAPSDDPAALDRVHHVAFDMIKKETLEDDSHIYDSNAWLFPYQVSGTK